jgi:hypothetical protein
MKSMWICRRPVYIIMDICIMAYSKPCLIQKKHKFSFLFCSSSKPITLIFSLLCMSYFTSLLMHNIFTKLTAFFFPFTHTIKSVTTKSTSFSQPNTLHHYTKNMCTLLLNGSIDSTATVFTNGVTS